MSNNKEAPAKNGEVMDSNVRYGRFRELAAPTVESERKHAAETGEQRWLVACFDSPKAFQDRFPDAASQEKILRILAETSEEVDQALKEVFAAPRT